VLDEVERQRRHLWTTAFIALVCVSGVVVVMSFWTDVFPDTIRDALGFPGGRFVFLILSIAFTVYAVDREREFRRVTRALLTERERREKLSEQEQARADLVARVTHELKTPLTSLLGYASIMRKRDATLSSEQRLEFLGTMDRQGQRIMRLIEEMLQSQRVEAGGLRPQRVALDVAGIARRVVAEMRVGHDRLIEADLPTEDLGLYGDPAGLEHVITNLVDNALKYSPEESVVRVAVFDGDGEVLVTVADEGVGISPEDMPHIFDRFRQASGARGRASVGLGLFIVRSLVEEQGGRVWADSEVGKGTTVTVALPRRRRS